LEKENTMINQADINNWFTYHAPTPEQLVAYNEIRTAAKIYAETVNKHVPDGADKTAAMRTIRNSVMQANLAIACYIPQPKPVDAIAVRIDPSVTSLKVGDVLDISSGTAVIAK
jgi:hypothetical protein